MKVAINSPKAANALVKYRIVLEGTLPLHDLVCTDDCEKPITNTRTLIDELEARVANPYGYPYPNVYAVLAGEGPTLQPVEIDLELVNHLG